MSLDLGTTPATVFVQVYNARYEVPICGAGFKFHQRVAGYPQNSHATTPPMATSLLNASTGTMQDPHPGRPAGDFSPPSARVATSLQAECLPLVVISGLCISLYPLWWCMVVP